ncbi:MAG: hypothetical protein MK086_11670 [Flavobacteriales bacterium]|nr:hypothetical protein [Flavobacteriales bacterium]
MKRSLIVFLLALAASPLFSQKVKMSDKAKGKYMKEEIAEVEEDESESIQVVQILTAEFTGRGEAFLISLQKPTSEIPNRASMLQFPELRKLAGNKISSNSEVDLLNYLAENGWSLITIEMTNFKGQETRKYYIQKRITP